ncbi:MAG: type II toxin-antitoxin system VapC family toxin [Nitrospiraceae bacterium]
MISVVVDASVAVKWVLASRTGEQDADKALLLLGEFQLGRVSIVQPPHWLAEVAAVVSRLDPETASEAVEVLHAFELPTNNSWDVYARACKLSVSLQHHLFDTLYHAVALTGGQRTLITADEQYYRKAQKFGRIVRLKECEKLMSYS